MYLLVLFTAATTSWTTTEFEHRLIFLSPFPCAISALLSGLFHVTF